MLRIDKRGVNDIVILDLHGSLRPGRAEEAFGERVGRILSYGCRKLIVNLADATSAGASGVSALLGALLAAREVGADIRLLHVTRGLTDMLVIVALCKYFTVFDSEEDALASFRVAPLALAELGCGLSEPCPDNAVAA